MVARILQVDGGRPTYTYTDSIHSIQMRLALNFGPVFDCTVVQPLPLLEWRLRRPETLGLAVGGAIWRAGTPPSVRFVWKKPTPRPGGASLGRGKLALAFEGNCSPGVFLNLCSSYRADG